MLTLVINVMNRNQLLKRIQLILCPAKHISTTVKITESVAGEGKPSSSS